MSRTLHVAKNREECLRAWVQNSKKKANVGEYLWETQHGSDAVHVVPLGNHVRLHATI